MITLHPHLNRAHHLHLPPLTEMAAPLHQALRDTRVKVILTLFGLLALVFGLVWLGQAMPPGSEEWYPYMPY